MKDKLIDYVNNKVNVSYRFVKEDDVDELFSENHQMSDYFERILAFNNERDFYIAITDDNIVGIAVLFKKYEARNRPNKDVISMTNIEIDPDFKNQGIGTELFQHVIEHCKEHDYILRRTDPTEEGQAFIHEKFGRMLKEQDVLFIPNNLAFIYDDLETSLFQDNHYSKQEKIELMQEVARQTIEHPVAKEYNLTVDKLSMNFLNESREVIESMKSAKKKKNNRKIKP